MGYGAELPAIAATARVLKQGTVSEQLAEYIIVQDSADGPIAHFVYLMRGEDGIWRVDSM